jgi:16S rRNA processing protein RimM
VALLEVGRVVKPHGLRGEVVVRFVSNRPERLRVGERFELGASQDGPSEEVIVESIRPQGHHHLVRFLGITDKENADRLRGRPLLAEEIEDPQALFVHQLIGCEVFDVEGTAHGLVTEVEANPASDILVVDGRFYVPMRFVVEHSEGRIVVAVPEGIFD